MGKWLCPRALPASGGGDKRAMNTVNTAFGLFVSGRSCIMSVYYFDNARAQRTRLLPRPSATECDLCLDTPPSPTLHGSTARCS